ncbi:hypothetical protein DXG01_010750 [Tephrocybe rancida]|nr:hypothetical protein DXG01_010750 [Tephrocybe rancida]
MRFSTLFNLSTLIIAGLSYAADKHLFVLQEQPGSDGKYHWRMLLGTKDPLQGTWHDVIWSDNCEIGMKHRSKEWKADRSKGVLGTYDLGSMKSQSEDKLLQVAKSTRTPHFDIADLKKNCQTWVEDVVHKLVAEKELPSSALTEMNKVPKQGPVPSPSSSTSSTSSGSSTSSTKSTPGSPKVKPKSALGSPKARSPSRPTSSREARSLRRAHLARAVTEAIKLAVREVEMDAFVARMETRHHWD